MLADTRFQLARREAGMFFSVSACGTKRTNSMGCSTSVTDRNRHSKSCPARLICGGVAMTSAVFCVSVPSLPTWPSGASFFAPTQAAHRTPRGLPRACLGLRCHPLIDHAVGRLQQPDRQFHAEDRFAPGAQPVGEDLLHGLVHIEVIRSSRALSPWRLRVSKQRPGTRRVLQGRRDRP